MRSLVGRTLSAIVMALAPSCTSDTSGLDDASGSRDASPPADASVAADAGATSDAAARDAGVDFDASSNPDAFVDASSMDASRPDARPADGGFSDAGPVQACTMPSDCAGTPPSVGNCFTSAWSCVDARCLWECDGGRTCSVPAAPGCINCGALTCSPINAPCGLLDMVNSPTVEDATCPFFPGTMQPFIGSSVTIVRASRSQCAFDAYMAGGVATLGSFYYLTDNTLVAYFNGLGGFCTGTFLPTGALRLVFSCPDCQFSLLF